VARELFLRLAAEGHRTIIGTDLSLHAHDDAARIALDGERLGAVVAESAARWRTPLAVPLMDLRLEKADILAAAGLSEDAADRFHFDGPPPQPAPFQHPFRPRQQAQIDAIQWVARNTPLTPCGMMIGPFSLTTKLLKDPITPMALIASGLTGEDDEGILAVERCLRMAQGAVERSARAQIQAGARAIIVCEPAASITFLSPRHLAQRPGTFDELVLQPNLRVKSLLDEAGVDLIFHDCGELTADMVRAYGHAIHPSVLSLGSSRRLWEDAALVPPDVTLFGNLPTKTFYSDAAMPEEEVRRLTGNLAARMRECRHPHIMGSECDVLHVPDASETILRKVEILLTEGR
jgi:uroporphyrinogen-III decarboxylase